MSAGLSIKRHLKNKRMDTRIRNTLVGGAVGFLSGITLLRGMWPITSLIGGGLGYLSGRKPRGEERMREYQLAFKRGSSGLSGRL